MEQRKNLNWDKETQTKEGSLDTTYCLGWIHNSVFLSSEKAKVRSRMSVRWLEIVLEEKVFLMV